MKTPEEIKKGLECCQPEHKDGRWITCKSICPFLHDFRFCRNVLHADALAYIQQLESGKWDMFFEITSAYYGKQMYGLNNDGTVYSRYSCEEMTFEQAVKEFKELISGE